MVPEFIITDRQVKNKIINLINDERLTPDMKRIRSGSTQLFRRDYGDRRFTDKENADVFLNHEEKNVYAELIEQKWYWVNGCCECNGEKRDWVNSYIECVKHDVCVHCKTPRAKLKEAPWGGKNGWICKPCQDDIDEKRKSELLATAQEYDEWDFQDLDTIKCPTCNDTFSEWWGMINSEEESAQLVDCPTCDHKFKITVKKSLSFDIEKNE